MIRTGLFHPRKPSRHGPPRPDEVLRTRTGSAWRRGGAQEHGARSAARVLLVGRIMIVLLSIVLLGLLGRVAQLQLEPTPQISQLRNTQASRDALMARRGAILDRHGRPLAITRVAHRLFVDPYLVADRNTFSEEVGYSLGYDPVEIEMRLHRRPDSRYVVIDRRMDDRRLARYRKMNLSGLATEPVLVRDYPQGQTAGQLIGFVGVEGKGLDGLELAWDQKLLGDPGQLRVMRDARRRAMWVDQGSYQPHSDGAGARLSLDLNIQTLAEAELIKTIEKFGAESGQLVVMDPRTGELLAVANFPLFDPNHFNDYDPQSRRNRVVTDVFEPGSIFKAIVWAALTEAGAARPNETIDTTTSGLWKPQRGPRLRDAHAHGPISWDMVLIKSSNIGMGKVAERVGIEKLHELVTAFGVGKPTGSGIPGEISGYLRKPGDWSATDLTRVPMGQGVSVTALQMMRAFAVLANDGLLVTPTIEALGPGTGPVDRIETRVLLPSTAAYTRSVLGRVVSEGTGRHARSDLYAVFGKTGTAQLPDFVNGGYHQDQYVSSFIAGAPLDDPRLIVGCFIKKPDRSKGHYGGVVAAPAVKAVIEQSLLYLGVPTQADPASDDRLVANR